VNAEFLRKKCILYGTVVLVMESKVRNPYMNNDKPLISFDYAIKYLLKDKGDYSIVEGFISALLKTKGYKDVKIIAP